MRSLKLAESTISLLCDRGSSMMGKLEDILFRAQRMAHALKHHLHVSDTMFGYDLRIYRRDLRAYFVDVEMVPNMMGRIARSVQFDESCLNRAQALLRLSNRLNKTVSTLRDHALLAHEHIRQADQKMDAWYLVQETERLAALTRPLLALANKIVISISTPPQGGQEAAPVQPQPPKDPPPPGPTP
ncbi:MAG TPA: hypothetical protein DEB40_09875 [Elusimicrobia bacterium]|nr:hypothetical protein [Elusimicrobiota bacterium]HBT62038.1 hypothetical protein [Elusimicrobiota bacterium]